MYNNQKIGIGIITYNRQQKFVKLYNSVKNNIDIDNIVIIKNKDIDYHKNDPSLIKNQKTEYFNVLGDVGVGACKNKALKYLLDQNCDHIFLIQDDVVVKRQVVFEKYIDTAKRFKLQHLNFCGCFIQHAQKIQDPVFQASITKQIGLDFFTNLCGLFQYFTKNILLKVGLMDQRYINALQHAQHTYRICKAGGYTPGFHLFGDIKNSKLYLEDGGVSKTTIEKNQDYNKNLMNAFKLFEQTYGSPINRIPQPTQTQLITFLSNRMIG